MLSAPLYLFVLISESQFSRAAQPHTARDVTMRQKNGEKKQGWWILYIYILYIDTMEAARSMVCQTLVPGRWVLWLRMKTIPSTITQWLPVSLKKDLCRKSLAEKSWRISKRKARNATTTTSADEKRKQIIKIQEGRHCYALHARFEPAHC